jgi:hypothetical protein
LIWDFSAIERRFALPFGAPDHPDRPLKAWFGVSHHPFVGSVPLGLERLQDARRKARPDRVPRARR